MQRQQQERLLQKFMEEMVKMQRDQQKDLQEQLGKMRLQQAECNATPGAQTQDDISVVVAEVRNLKKDFKDQRDSFDRVDEFSQQCYKQGTDDQPQIKQGMKKKNGSGRSTGSVGTGTTVQDTVLICKAATRLDHQKRGDLLRPPDDEEGQMPMQSSFLPTPQTWSEVVRKKRKTPMSGIGTQPIASTAKDRRRDAAWVVKKQMPKTEAVIIDNLAKGETSATIMGLVTFLDVEAVDAEVKGATLTKTGSILIEVASKQGVERLAAGIRGVVGNKAAVRRPQHVTPVLLLDLLNWIREADVPNVLANIDPCLKDTAVKISYGSHGARLTSKFRCQ